jgi:hypothetical protein
MVDSQFLVVVMQLEQVVLEKMQQYRSSAKQTTHSALQAQADKIAMAKQ